MIKMFRALRADEIDVRVAIVKPTYVSLLLYKDARCDMNILDETVGAMNWQRSHLNGNANCVVSIYDTAKGQWISKEDTGTESNTEREKGQASDSFKRACFNWGIGRELYTSPQIIVWANSGEVTINGTKCYDKFYVSNIETENGCIKLLEIKNQKTNRVAFNWTLGQQHKTSVTQEAPVQSHVQPTKATYKCEVCGKTIADFVHNGTVKKTVNEILGASISRYDTRMCCECLTARINTDKAGAVNGN